jgi:hypothetical protein
MQSHSSELSAKLAAAALTDWLHLPQLHCHMVLVLLLSPRLGQYWSGFELCDTDLQATGMAASEFLVEVIERSHSYGFDGACSDEVDPLIRSGTRIRLQ